MHANPFVWARPISDGVSREPFTSEVVDVLLAGTDVALFGPRGTGKTSFLSEVSSVVKDRRPRGEAWETLHIDLRSAISIPAFSAAVSKALSKHPSRKLRNRARAVLSQTQKEFELNLGFVRAGVRSGNKMVPGDSEFLYAQLSALSDVADRVVIAFDEFQRLNSCPGEPLSIIRSALMGPENTQKVALLLTGSLRERLALMLHTSTEPIWDQTADFELPPIDSNDLSDYLERRFLATDRAIEPRAVEDLVVITANHPKRAQHLAWKVWQRTRPGDRITRSNIQASFDELVIAGDQSAEFAHSVEMLLSGSDMEINDARTLFLLASGGSPGSTIDIVKFGLTHRRNAGRAVKRLQQRGLVVPRGRGWQICDPLFAEWLKRQNPTSGQHSLPQP